MPTAQEATNAQPIQCQCQHSGMPAFGNPTASNAVVVTRAVTCNPVTQINPRAPFNCCTDPQRPTTRGAGFGFKSKLFCTRCGFRKKDHCSLPFGHECTKHRKRRVSEMLHSIGIPQCRPGWTILCQSITHSQPTQ